MRAPLAAALVLFSLLSPRVSRAQMPPQDDRAIEVQLFEPALGTHSFLTVSGARLMGRDHLQLGMALTFVTKPFSVFFIDRSTGGEIGRTEVIKSLAAGYLSGA